MRRLLYLSTVVALVGIACDDGEINFGELRPEPSEPATGPVVRELLVRDVTFRLHDEGAGCLAVDIDRPDLQTTVARQCFDGEVVDETPVCGWTAVVGDESAEQAAGCDVMLPPVFFGRALDPLIGHVCVGTIEPNGDVTGARFLDLDEARYILDEAAPNEVPAGHLFTRRGERFGDPPLDAPSGPIYETCEDLAPWEEAR